MITLQEFCHYLNVLMVADTFTDSCPNGLQIEGRAEVRNVVTAVSASLATIEAAIAKGADALVVHHGIFWNGDSFTITGVRRKKIQLLLENGISLLAYHLPLDADRQVGNNWKAAIDLEWLDLEPFGLYKGQYIGVKGSLPQPLSPKELQNQLEGYYGHSATYAPAGNQSPVSTVALISGGAYKSIQEAANEGVHAFITGNFDEPAWHIAQEEGVHFYALGHAATERIGPIALAEHIQHNLDLPAQFLDLPNPF